MKKSLLLLVLCFSLVEASAPQKIRRTFSCYPGVDELKLALISSDWPKIQQLMPERFPLGIHAQYVYLGLSQNQGIRNYILNEIFTRWNRCVLESPRDALRLILMGLSSLFTDYGDDLDKGFLEILSRLQVSLLMCPIISRTHELHQAALRIAPMKNIFMTAYIYANQNQQAQSLRDRKAYAISRSRPQITAPWPLGG